MHTFIYVFYAPNSSSRRSMAKYGSVAADFTEPRRDRISREIFFTTRRARKNVIVLFSSNRSHARTGNRWRIGPSRPSAGRARPFRNAAAGTNGRYAERDNASRWRTRRALAQRCRTRTEQRCRTRTRVPTRTPARPSPICRPLITNARIVFIRITRITCDARTTFVNV